MRFFKRDISGQLKEFSKFPVVGILGPRQSGKTTLAKHYFKNHTFVNLEDLELRAFAKEDPKKFLSNYENKNGLIIDEFQYVPSLLSYIQIEVDEKRRPGYFVLTGSQNFLMNQAITQSLAGRIGILTLLPLSINEMEKNKLLSDVDSTIVQGSYPRLYLESIIPSSFYPSYIQTYIERDVRQITNVTDLLVFQKFMKLCAARTGQLLNLSEIAMQCGISNKVATNWISVLTSSYIVFLLRPHFTNFNKRIVKAPKLYFYDTGLASSLLELRSEKDIAFSQFRGHLFENLIISDFYKQYFNIAIEPPLYFWRDQNDRVEVDCIISTHNQLIPVEIKSGHTATSDFFEPLKNWSKISGVDPSLGYIVYAGDLSQDRAYGKLISWKKAGNLIQKIEE